MANFYTNSEMTDIHFMYGRAKDNASKAARLYHAAYPNHRQPSRRMFSKIYQRLRETEQFIPNLVDCGRLRLVRNSCIQGCKKDHTVWNISHDQLLHPCHVQHVQALLPVDLQQRIIFCQWLLHRCNSFFVNGFFIDAIKIHNRWGNENPHAIIASRHQHRFFVNV
ncbi:hypothetical protein ALC57_05307 [Trachymyrmex cornetzi]|uniref:DUF4817 domain-containing protein n=1 Tax=Trachymyrmex cornetzi TaxID=471704 RepID=A0A151JBC9_9HYME|nr:hypothetical protein ALC57_05307 [Trachymyrmex cornetzi]